MTGNHGNSDRQKSTILYICTNVDSKPHIYYMHGLQKGGASNEPQSYSTLYM